MNNRVDVDIETDNDLVEARAAARTLATGLGFSRTDATLIATAISEVARNIVVHVGKGTLVCFRCKKRHALGAAGGRGEDVGIGIRDIAAALEDGYAGRGGLGLDCRALVASWTISRSKRPQTTERASR